MKRLLAILLTIAMVATLLVPSLVVFAEETGTEDTGTEDTGTEVVDYSDSVPPTKNANMLHKDLNHLSGNGQGSSSYRGGSGTPWDLKGWWGYQEKIGAAAGNYFCAGEGYFTEAKGGLLENIVAGTTYVASAHFFNYDPSKKATVKAGLSYGVQNGCAISWDVSSPETLKYTGRFTAEKDSTNVSFGLDDTISHKDVTEETQGIAVFDYSQEWVYLAPEQLYEVAVSSSLGTKLFPGNTTVISAEHVNQVGDAYGDDHNFTYIALNADRTAVEEAITLTDNGDGTVSAAFAEDIAEGTYVILAVSSDNEGMQKGIEIEVITADAYADLVPVPWSTNLFKNATGYNFNGGNSGSAGVGWSDGSGKPPVIFKAKNSFDLTVTPNASWGTLGTFIKVVDGGDGGDNRLKYALEPDSTYKITAYIQKYTDVSSEDANPTFAMTLGAKTFPREHGQEGVEVTASGDDWQLYEATFDIGDKTTAGFWVGLTSATEGDIVALDSTQGMTFTKVAGPYDIVNDVTGLRKIFPGTETTLTTTVVDEDGSTDGLNQNFEYVVLNENKTAFELGITVTTADGVATVSVGDDVAPGVYNVVAMSQDYDGYNRTTQIEVVDADSFEDSAATTDNLVTDPGSLGYLVGGNGAGNISFDRSKDSTEELGYIEGAHSLGADPNWAAGLTYITLAEPLSPDKTYVVSALLKNGNPSVNPCLKAAASAGGKESSVTWDVTSSEYETYTGRFTPTKEYTELGFGLNTKIDRRGYTEGQFGTLWHDYSNGGSLYVAEEVISVNNTITGLEEFFVGQSTTAEAFVENQVGMTEGLDQDITFAVLTSDRSAYADGFDIAVDEDGIATITATTAVPGTYVLVASADGYTGIQTGAEFVVVGPSTFADHVATEDYSDNLLLNPTSASSSLAGMPDGNGEAYNSGSYRVYRANKTFTMGPTGNWAVSGDLVKTDAVSEALVKGQTYVAKVRIKKHAGATPKFSVALWGTYGSYNFPMETGSTGVTPGTDWEDYTATMVAGRDGARLALGLRSGTYDETTGVKDLIYMDMTQGVYLAKERAHDITFAAQGSTNFLAGGSKTVTAQVTNQVGYTGNLDQEFELIALTAERDGYVDGFTFVEGENGEYTVEVAQSVAPGSYVLYARHTSGIGTGIQIQVVDSLPQVTELTVDLSQDGVAKLVSGAAVNGLDCANVMFVIASYNEAENKLVAADKVVAAVDEGFAYLDADITIDADTGNTVKVFVWQTDTYTPIEFVSGIENVFTK